MTEVGNRRRDGLSMIEALPWFDYRDWKKVIPWTRPRYWFLEMWVPHARTGYTNDVDQWTYVRDTNVPRLREYWQRQHEERVAALEASVALLPVSGTEGLGDF